MDKYKLTQETKIINGVTLHRIEALKDFGDVKKGDLGGYIENEKNLSQWHKSNAQVCGGEMYGSAEVSGDAWVSTDAAVSEIITLNGKRYKLIKENK